MAASRQTTAELLAALEIPAGADERSRLLFELGSRLNRAPEEGAQLGPIAAIATQHYLDKMVSNLNSLLFRVFSRSFIISGFQARDVQEKFKIEQAI